LTGPLVFAQETRLLRSPSINHDKISFVYAGDIWVGMALMFKESQLLMVRIQPHFSKWTINCFTGEYDGNMDVCIR
jgi:hypothetical protein